VHDFLYLSDATCPVENHEAADPLISFPKNAGFPRKENSFGAMLSENQTLLEQPHFAAL
jgi:hypothetical protein